MCATADFDRLKLELKRILHSMMMEETKAWLIRSLLKQKLATWDVFNFAVHQAELRTSIKTLDWQTVNAALRAKLKDTRQTLNREKKKKSQIECTIRRDFSHMKTTLKQIMAPWKNIIKKEKEVRLNGFRRKIKHLKKKQEEKTYFHRGRKIAQTHVPKFLQEYSRLKIFAPAVNFPRKEKLNGPFVGRNTIKLSEGEIRVLSRHPKYSVRKKVDATDYKIEIEKMNAKKKFGLQSILKEDINKTHTVNMLHTGGEVLDTSLNDSERELKQMWEEERERELSLTQ